MRVFITGGSGFIGQRLAERLIAGNNEVILLLRDPGKTPELMHAGCQVIKGDVLNKPALIEGMRNCDLVFHLAAYTRPWSKDPEIPYKINVTGTVNILETAFKTGVPKVVVTSTAGTMSFSHDGRPVGESTNPDPEFHTSYERTKAEAEKVCVDYSRKGLDVVIVNPTRVYGPGELTKSNSLTRIIKLYRKGLWRILPGDGNSVGNYVYIDNVVSGHILAASKGLSGERYILGGENLSYTDLFRIIGEESGSVRRLVRLPLPFLKAVLRCSTLFADITGLQPLLTREWLDKYLKNWIMSSDKAKEHLGYDIIPFRTGVGETFNWIDIHENQNGK
ncbi:MAG: NAD-dependent epimerase/dehydratase family protein [Bacteroidales bacterium]|nr:NAD-dependent epimerase/dehydratase family protein [Bacteroidales bacterium]